MSSQSPSSVIEELQRRWRSEQWENDRPYNPLGAAGVCADELTPLLGMAKEMERAIEAHGSRHPHKTGTALDFDSEIEYLRKIDAKRGSIGMTEQERLRARLVKLGWGRQKAFKLNLDDLTAVVCRVVEDEKMAAPTGSTPLKEAQAALERDRTKVAECVTAVKDALENYDWLIEGRGSYEWDDDRWHDEFKAASEAIAKAIEPMVHIAADLSNCPKTQAEVAEARASAPIERPAVAEEKHEHPAQD